jgi:SWI/SNF-related matrix-associated actin-dependent regulator 1 of chromatin subfamily A
MILRDYQKTGVERLIEIAASRKAAILADEPGLGKTIQVCEFINRTRADFVLIVCPASLRTNWWQEILRWVVPTFQHIEVVSYEQATRGKLQEARYELIVFDEAHYLKNPSAARTQKCLSLDGDIRLFLTGTPIVNRPIELYPILRSCGLQLSRTEYGKRYCDGKLVVIRWRPKKYAWDFSGASRTEELGASLRKHLMVRRTKEEVLSELPRKIRQVIELPDRTLPESENLRRVFASFTSAAGKVAADLKVAFDELSQVRLETARAKLNDVIEFAENLLLEEPKLVIFAYHREIIDALADHFGAEAVKLYGGMTDKQKAAAVDAFQNGKTRVFVGQITAAGTGLTLTAARTVLFAEIDWVPGNLIQCEDRCHRFGQRSSVRVFHLTAAGSIEARMIQALVEKQKTIEAVTS